MLKIGKMNLLRILKKVDFGLYLDGFEQGEILLPKKVVPENYEIDDEIEVFIYNDSEDRLIATTEKPKAQVGDIALLKLISQNKFGAFFDWGLSKDLFVPISEQVSKMTIEEEYPIFVYLDTRSDRVAGSCRIDKYLKKDSSKLKKGNTVNLMIYQKTEMGYKAIINESTTGLIFENEIFQQLKIGQKLEGFIKQIRNDGKIDLSLQKPSLDSAEATGQKIIEYLELNEGFSSINDKSSPELISETFGISKKSFKKAIGNLYRSKKITISPLGINLSKK